MENVTLDDYAFLISLCILLSGLVLFSFWFLINIRRQL
nr:MAG TPA: hypothetical protein [Caudoviricetes sp.]